MKKEILYVIGGFTIGFLLISAIRKKNNILFMGGLENSIPLSKQVKSFKEFNNNSIVVHSYKEIDKLKQSISKEPNAIVVLFSAGGKYANDIVELVNNPRQIYVIEPYTCNREITNKIPKSNIFGGSSCETGSNVAGVKRSDYGGESHLQSLVEIGKRLK